MVDLTVLLSAQTSYLQSVSPSYDETLQAVIDRVRRNGSIGKDDIGALTFWKRLRADTTWSSRLQQLPDTEVRSITAKAVAVVRDQTLTLSESARLGREALLPLPGCGHGHALPSALLFAAAPDRMAVYDRRAEAGLHLLRLSSGGTYSGYMSVVASLLEQLQTLGVNWRARDVDTALYEMGRPTR